MPKASYDGAAMANVCRPLQNGLPALRFAVIRGFWLLLVELGSEPARVVFRLSCFSCDYSPALKTHETAAWTFPVQLLTSIAFDAGETPTCNSTKVTRWHGCGRSHGCLIHVLPREPAALRELS